MESKAMYCGEQIQIPRELGAVMKAYTKAVILAEPTNLNKWSANYFAEMAGRPLPFPNLQNERKDATSSQPQSAQPTPRSDAGAAQSAQPAAPQQPVQQPAALAPVAEAEEQAEAQRDVAPTPSEGSPQYEGQEAGTPMGGAEGVEETAEANAESALVDAVMQQVDELAQQGQYEAGLELINEALQQQPRSADLFYRRGHFNHHYIQDGDAALTDYNACLALDDQYADAYRGRADLLHYGSENPAEALDDYTKAVELGRHDPDTLTQRATLYRTLNLVQEAMNDITAALEQNPNHVDAIRVRADVYNYHLDNTELALADYNVVLSGECEEADVFVSRGELLRRTGLYEEAMRDFEAALAIDETNEAAQDNIAALHEQMGQEADDGDGAE